MIRSLGVLFSFACVVIAVCQVAPVFADVPAVTGITAWTRQSDNHTILNITVVHNGYYSGHYVEWIPLNVSDTFQQISLTESSPVDQTASSTFVVPYDMGVVTDSPTVQAQAYCTVHGSGSWSTVLTVPEFSSLQLVLILMVLTVTALFFRFKSVKGHLRAFAGGARSVLGR
jgi:desulfoferrodoxin (superoxide reductase-like protein)